MRAIRDAAAAMKKAVTVLAFLPWVLGIIALGSSAWAAAPPSGPPTAPGQYAAAEKELLKLLPRTTTAMVVFDAKRLEGIDAVLGPLRQFFEFIKVIGADPGKDIAYVGHGEFIAPAGEIDIVNLRYDKAKLRKAIKKNVPGAKEETYNGVTVYSHLNEERKELPADVALLDATHIVLSSDAGVKGVIDVYRKKAESLAMNREMVALLSEVDKSRFAWGITLLPPELVKKGVETVPLFKAFEAVKGLTLALDDTSPGSIAAEIKLFGGTREQSAGLASVLTGLKALGMMASAQEPALGELLKGTAITAGDDHARLSFTLSRDAMEALVRLAQSQAGDQGAGEEWDTLLDEADGLYRQGDHERALESCKKALEIAEKNAGPDHPDVAVSLNLLALIDQAQGRYEEAEALYKRALAIDEKAFGPDDPNVATILVNFGSLYSAQERDGEAEPLLKRALAIEEKALGPDDPEVAELLDNLALLYRTQGRYGEAEVLQKRALAIYEKVEEPDDPDLAISLDNLASLCFAMGRYAEAESHAEQARRIFEKALGPDHPDLAVCLDNLASIVDVLGRYAEAESLCQRAMAIREKAFGPDHPDVAMSLDSLAQIYLDQERFAEAAPLLDRALAIAEKTLGPDHPTVATVLNDLALLALFQDRYADAEPLFLRSLEITEKALGPDHPSVAGSLNNLAELYSAQDRDALAGSLYDRSLTITEKALGPDHPTAANSLSGLAGVYFGQGEFELAEPLLERSLAISKKALGPDHPHLAAILEMMAAVCRATDREDEAEAHEARAARIRAIKR